MIFFKRNKILLTSLVEMTMKLLVWDRPQESVTLTDRLYDPTAIGADKVTTPVENKGWNHSNFYRPFETHLAKWILSFLWIKFRLNLRDIAFLKLKNIYNYCLAFLKRKWINKHFEPNYWSSLLRNHSITHIIQIHTNMIIKIHKYIYVLICFFWYLNWFTWIYINGKFSRGTEWECSGHAC